jgi:hypothetical protein
VPPAIQPGQTDLFLPLPRPGESMDPYTVHTHYFGFSVPEAAIGAYIYLRCQPAFGLAQGGVIIFRGLDNPTLLDAEHHDYRATMPWPQVDGQLIRVDNGLEIEFVQPGEVVRLRYTSPDKSVSFDLEQRAITPLLARGHIVPGEEDHHGDPNRVPGGIEQFLHCTGELTLRQERFPVDCAAVRDRSWLQIRREDPGGARRTPPLGWTPMRFGPDLALNAVSIEAADTDPAWLGLYDLPAGTPASFHAWLVRDGKPRWLTDVRRDVLEYHPTMYAALRQRLEVVDETGERYRFAGEAIAMAAMHSWPNVAFHDSVYRWTDEWGRIAHCTYQEIWFDDYQRAMKQRHSRVVA